MTDKEIIKSLEECIASEGCYECIEFTNPYCMNNVMEHALGLIKQQQKRIERLKDNLDAVLKERADHTEAVEEFADKIVEQLEAEIESSDKFIREYDDSEVQKAWNKGLRKALELVKGVQNE